MRSQSEYWYSLSDADRADLIEAISYTLTTGDDNAIHVSNIARDVLGDQADFVGGALDEIADRLRKGDG